MTDSVNNRAATDAYSLLEDATFVEELARIADTEGKTPEQAQKYARKCLHEIEATPRDSWLNPAARLARFIYTRSYERQLDINLPALEELRAVNLYKSSLMLQLGSAWKTVTALSWR